jgi:uncharacterized membrane protein (DUF4010 family)
MNAGGAFEPFLGSLGIAFGLGLLVGLERQRSHSHLAGIRTFALVTTLGALLAILAGSFGGWLVGVGLLAVVALLAIGNHLRAHGGDFDAGQTTEAAVLVMYGVGALVVVGPTWAAVALGGAVLVLLQSKTRLHGWVERLGERDLTAIARFVLISLVILPVLPDQAYGPWLVLNPRRLWWMVVLIVAMNLLGYVASKLLGPRRGALLAGLLGGLVSSTAATFAAARRSRAEPASAAVGAVVVVVASAVAFPRMAVEVSAVAPAMAPRLLLALAPGFVLLIAGAFVLLRFDRGSEAPPTEAENPTELRPALVFAVLYGGVLLAVEAARTTLGQQGLFAVAALAGLTDIDAITLSTSELVATGRLDAPIACRALLIAAAANLVFKAAVAASLGNRRLALRLAAAFLPALVALAVGAASVASGS